MTGNIFPGGNSQPKELLNVTVTELTDSLRKKSLVDLIGILSALPISPPSLYLDLEGINLSRHGTISILQIFVLPENTAYLVDVFVLREEAFTTADVSGQTLKAILESNAIPKVFFDLRNDSDALYAHFGVKLGGIHDLQLMELATRTFPKKYVNGLSRCLERDAGLSASEKEKWKLVKEEGKKLFAPELGGTYEVFNTRPLADEIMVYCTQDVQFMPKLWNIYFPKLTSKWTQRVKKATEERVTQSQRSIYIPDGPHKTRGPW